MSIQQQHIRHADIEDVYPLTPMQVGILYHVLRAAESGPYIEQFVFDAPQAPDAERLRAAWNAVIARHPALRSAVVWEGLDEPLQVVVRNCVIGINVMDLREQSAAGFAAALGGFLAADRALGFCLADAPLMRLTMLLHGPGCVVVWTLHHLVMDGWSMPITISEVAQHYRKGPGAIPSQAPPFRDYISWLRSRQSPVAEQYWQDRLDHLQTRPCQVSLPGLESEYRGTAGAGRAYHALSPRLTAAVTRAARAARVTQSTAFQAAWALVLAAHSGASDTLFGLTVSGRPPDLPRADAIVGVMINTIPRRIRVDRSATVGDWLRAIQADYLDTIPYQHSGLPDIQKRLTLPASSALFDSILVFENYPSENPQFDLGDTRLTVREIIEDAGYPLTLTVLPRQPSIRLQLLYDVSAFSDDSAKTMLGRLETALSQIVANLDAGLAEVGVLSAPDARAIVAMPDPAEPELSALAGSDTGGTAARPAVCVLDSERRLAPVGVPGDVFLVFPDPRTGQDWTGQGQARPCRQTALRGVRTAGGALRILRGGQAVTDHEPALRPAGPAAVFARPAGGLLRDLWIEALDRPVESPDLDFFRAGGDSLAAVSVIGKIRVLFGTPLPVATLFEARTLENLLRRIEDQVGGPESADTKAAGIRQ